MKFEKLFQHRSPLLWLTALLCFSGYFLYSQIPVELLPKETQKFVLIQFHASAESPISRSEAWGRIVQAVASQTHQSHDTWLEVEADGTVQALFENPGRIQPAKIRQAVSKALALENLTVPFDVAELDSSRKALMTILMTQDSLQSTLAQASSIRSVAAELGRVPGVAALFEVDDHNGGLKSFAQSKFIFEPSSTFLPLAAPQVSQLAEQVARRDHFSQGRVVVKSAPNLLSQPLQQSNRFETPHSWAQSLQWNPGLRSQMDSPLLLRNGKPVRLFQVYKQLQANEIQTSDLVRAKTKQLANRFGSTQIDIISDSADYIREAEKNVVSNAWEGTLLTSICVILIMRSLRSGLLISLSIPISLLLTFVCLYFANISRNVMSLAGIALGIGVIVDSCICIVTSIERLLEDGVTPVHASLKAIDENLVPILTTILTTLAVFLPILFLPGSVGDYFYDLSFAVIASQAISFFVSVFIVPPLASLNYELFGFRRRNKNHLDKNLSAYGWFSRTLDTILKSPLAYWTTALVTVVGVVWSFTIIPPQEFFPSYAKNNFRARVIVGQGSSRQERSWVTEKLENVLSEAGFTERLIRSDKNSVLADFKSSNVEKSEFSVLEKRLAAQIPNFKILVAPQNPLNDSASLSQDLTFYVDATPAAAQTWRAALAKVSGIRWQAWAHEQQAPLAQISMSPDLSQNLVPAHFAPVAWQLAREPVTLGLSALNADSVNRNESEVNLVAVDLSSQSRWLNPITGLPSAAISDVFRTRVIRGTQTVFYHGQKRVERIQLALENRAPSEVQADIQHIADTQHLSLTWDRSLQDTSRAMDNLKVCILVAVALTVLVLFTMNRSLIATAIILFTFIWSLLGAFPGLVIHHDTLNASALVGFILLAGTVVNHGILLMDIIAKKQRLQFSPRECCMMAVQQRTTNVIVTSLTTALGMLPMVFETGAGSQMYRGMSIVVVYGTVVSTPVCLFALPCLVMIFGDLREQWEKNRLRFLILARQPDKSTLPYTTQKPDVQLGIAWKEAS